MLKIVFPFRFDYYADLTLETTKDIDFIKEGMIRMLEREGYEVRREINGVITFENILWPTNRGRMTQVNGGVLEIQELEQHRFVKLQFYTSVYSCFIFTTALILSGIFIDPLLFIFACVFFLATIAHIITAKTNFENQLEGLLLR